MSPDRLALFILAELVFSATPGPTVMLISAHGFRGGFRAALAAICGTQTGNVIWFAASAAGLGALVLTWPLAFDAIRYVGAGYLIWLGAREVWISFGAGPGGHAPDPARQPAHQPYAQALLTQLSNPKALLFFGALVPQFLDTAHPLAPQYGLMLAIILIGESTILSLYGWLAAMGGRGISANAGAHAMWRMRIGGAVLVGLGILFAFTRGA